MEKVAKKRGRPPGPRDTTYIVLGLLENKIEMYSVIATSSEQAWNDFKAVGGTPKQVLGPFHQTAQKKEDLKVSLTDELVFSSYLGTGTCLGLSGSFFELVDSESLAFFPDAVEEVMRVVNKNDCIVVSEQASIDAKEN